MSPTYYKHENLLVIKIVMQILSPFRYPGAKNKMLPILMEYLYPLLQHAEAYVEPFVGGASVLLEVARKYPKMQLFINDKDLWISSFWKVISDPDVSKVEQLLVRMEEKPTIDLFYALREQPTNDEIDFAYRGIFFNRTTFSGILTSGPIGGETQKSKWTVDCRYNFPKLKSKILHCRSLLMGRITVGNMDFSQFQSLINTTYPAYIDPPYFVKGDALYSERMRVDDHQALAQVLANRSNFVLSYDDHPEVRAMYHGKTIIDHTVRYTINGRKNVWKTKNELIIIG